jgi:hypothetical protein
VLGTVAENIAPLDGLTVDADGDIWVASYGGGRFHRYSPHGRAAKIATRPWRSDHLVRFHPLEAQPALHRHCTERWSEDQHWAEITPSLVYRPDTEATGRLFPT